MGAVAYAASELILHTKKKEEISTTKTLYETLSEAKNENSKIYNMIDKVEDTKLKDNIKEIHDTVSKIINTIEKKPEKYKSMNNFFSYYLPVTLNILIKYDEIENQKLSSEDSKKFMLQTENMIEKINSAFKNQLSNLYQSSIVDTDAEMKVFESMLEADGYDTTNDFKIKKEEE